MIWLQVHSLTTTSPMVAKSAILTLSEIFCCLQNRSTFLRRRVLSTRFQNGERTRFDKSSLSCLLYWNVKEQKLGIISFIEGLWEKENILFRIFIWIKYGRFKAECSVILMLSFWTPRQVIDDWCLDSTNGWLWGIRRLLASFFRRRLFDLP